MLNMLEKLIQETLKTGTGQAVIAFSAWSYVLILAFVTLYYAFLSLLKLMKSKK